MQDHRLYNGRYTALKLIVIVILIVLQSTFRNIVITRIETFAKSLFLVQEQFPLHNVRHPHFTSPRTARGAGDNTKNLLFIKTLMTAPGVKQGIYTVCSVVGISRATVRYPKYALHDGGCQAKELAKEGIWCRGGGG